MSQLMQLSSMIKAIALYYLGITYPAEQVFGQRLAHKTVAGAAQTKS
jgi:hypothetical protein